MYLFIILFNLIFFFCREEACWVCSTPSAPSAGRRRRTCRRSLHSTRATRGWGRPPHTSSRPWWTSDGSRLARRRRSSSRATPTPLRLPSSYGTSPRTSVTTCLHSSVRKQSYNSRCSSDLLYLLFRQFSLHLFTLLYFQTIDVKTEKKLAS